MHDASSRLKGILTYDAVVFDVGGTLLRLVRDPHEMALEVVAHLGTASPRALHSGVQQALEEWRAAGGPAHEQGDAR